GLASQASLGGPQGQGRRGRRLGSLCHEIRSRHAGRGVEGARRSIASTCELRVYIDALQWAEACVFCFPTWWSGMPAVLKGYFDRVWRPGVAFDLPTDGGTIKPALLNIRRMGVVTTFGSPWCYTRLYMQDPGRKVLLRGLKSMCGRTEKHLFLAKYSVEGISNEEREKFARKVEQRFERF
ncbi:MAG: hypothetical protein E5W15_27225, partial [Mesorhizobium sp.]